MTLATFYSTTFQHYSLCVGYAYASNRAFKGNAIICCLIFQRRGSNQTQWHPIAPPVLVLTNSSSLVSTFDIGHVGSPPTTIAGDLLCNHVVHDSGHDSFGAMSRETNRKMLKLLQTMRIQLQSTLDEFAPSGRILILLIAASIVVPWLSRSHRIQLYQMQLPGQ